MSSIRARATINRSMMSMDYSTCDDIHEIHKFNKKTILSDKSLTRDEKKYAIKLINRTYDKSKIFFNEGTRRICENCNQKCLATLFCEYCVQNHLKANFSNWTSGNNDIDKLIQKCQSETCTPDKIIEWIPYNKLKDVKYLTKGGFAEIYTAVWIDGGCVEWDPKQQQLLRAGSHKMILKELKNVESANQKWFEEVCIL
jgi:hypothetical protein